MLRVSFRAEEVAAVTGFGSLPGGFREVRFPGPPFLSLDGHTAQPIGTISSVRSTFKALPVVLEKPLLSSFQQLETRRFWCSYPSEIVLGARCVTVFLASTKATNLLRQA